MNTFLGRPALRGERYIEAKAFQTRMSQIPQLALDSPVRTIEFRQLARESSKGLHLENLVSMLGVVYVTSITRDGCSGCIEQKPFFRELAARMEAGHPGGFSFTNIHIQYSEKDSGQSREAKKALRHAAYPTYTIHVNSKFGPLELYRAIYPSMEELEKQAAEALDLADYYKTDAEKLKD